MEYYLSETISLRIAQCVVRGRFLLPMRLPNSRPNRLAFRTPRTCWGRTTSFQPLVPAGSHAPLRHREVLARDGGGTPSASEAAKASIRRGSPRRSRRMTDRSSEPPPAPRTSSSAVRGLRHQHAAVEPAELHGADAQALPQLARLKDVLGGPSSRARAVEEAKHVGEREMPVARQRRRASPRAASELPVIQRARGRPSPGTRCRAKPASRASRENVV